MGQSPSRPPDAPRRRRSVLSTVKRRSSQILRRRSHRQDDKDQPTASGSLPTVDEPLEQQPIEPNDTESQHSVHEPEPEHQHQQQQQHLQQPEQEHHPEQSAYSPGTLVVVQGVVHTGQDSAQNAPQDVSDPLDSNEQSASTPLDSSPALIPESQPTAPSIQSPADAPRPLSPSSIDVLGTLLSVAAAATAASLLTSSSEPILSSGLGTPPTPSPPSSSHPTPLQEPSPGNERMRQTWGSIRDRLGLRSTLPTSPSPYPSQPSTPVPPSTPASISDARRLMLSEMARAFSLGTSSTTADTSSVDSSPSDSHLPSNPNPAPEGSFERFLIDLQSDLRSALAGFGADPSSSEPNNTTLVNEPESPLDHPHSLPSSPDPNSPPPEQPDPISHTASSSSSRESSTSSSNDTSPSVDSTANSDPLQGPSSATTNLGRNRVNWWRMYRFPAVTAPPSRNTAPSTIPASGIPLAGVPPAGLPASSASPAATPFSNVPADLDSNNGPAHNHTVIPVIVVGLQSVISPRNRETLDPSGQPPVFPSEDLHTPTPDIVTPSSSTVPAPFDHTRQDSWPSRAATAFRNSISRSSPDSEPETAAPDPATQPPASNADDNEQNNNNRTFLIYVIGGYYPPTHSIVTSGLGPGNLDSFEALLEIAELLGQAKKPTASKEDIEKSGLDVVSASDLGPEHGKEVMDNCLERCLICLEDYAPSDPVRVMQCRHAFHKDCVDTWLETGRNNCPACRSQGVSTATSPTTSPPPTTVPPNPGPP